MAISQNFPNTPPSLFLDFAKSKKLDSRITFTRGSTGTYVDDNGLIRTAGINEPRFDHDPNTLKSLGLLIEESRTNLLLQSTTPDNLVSPWGKGTNTTRIGTTTAPDGTNTSVYYSGDGSSANEFVNQQVNLSANTTYTISVWAKLISGSVPTAGVIIAADYDNGTTAVRATIPFNGNLTTEWKRFSVTYTNVRAVTGYGQYFIADQNNTAQIAIWGAQLEVGSFATSYIPTVASTVTRAADVASITGTNFSSWYNYNEGTFFTKASFPYPNNVNTNYSVFSVGLYPGAASMEYFITFTDYPRFSYFNSSLVEYTNDPTSGAAITKGFNSASLAYTSSATFASFNGGSVTTNSSIPGTLTSSAANRLIIGGAQVVGAQLQGYISQLIYYPRRLTNTQLQNLTR